MANKYDDMINDLEAEINNMPDEKEGGNQHNK